MKTSGSGGVSENVVASREALVGVSHRGSLKTKYRMNLRRFLMITITASATSLSSGTFVETTFNISTIAGRGGSSGYYGDGTLGNAAGLSSPTAIWGTNNNIGDYLLITDRGNKVIRKLTTEGIITTWAGNNAMLQRTGTTGAATSLFLNAPYGIWGDSTAEENNNNVYVSEYDGNVIDKITTTEVGTQIMTVFAGTLYNGGYGGDNGPATSARLNGCAHVTGDSNGNLYFADSWNHRVRQVTTSATILGYTSIIITVAGNGLTDNDQYRTVGPATSHAITVPVGVAVDMLGNIYISSDESNTVRIVTSGDDIEGGGGRVMRLYAGGGQLTYTDDNSRYDPLDVRLKSPYSVFVDTQLNVYIANKNDNSVLKISAIDGLMGKIAGKTHDSSPSARYKGDGGTATSATMYGPWGIWGGPDGTLYVADTGNHAVRKLGVVVLGTQPEVLPSSQSTAQPTQPTSQPTAEPTQPTSQPTASPTDFSSRAAPLSETIYNISTIIGQNGASGYYGDGSVATSGALNSPTAVWGNIYGDVFITDRGNNVLRKVAKNGILTTCAGNTALTTRVTSSGMATQAPLSAPYGVWGDSAGNVFVTEYSSHVVNKITDNVVITIVAGILQTSGFTTDNVAATSSRLNSPCHITGDVYGNVYFADSFNHRIRKLTFSSLFSVTITTFAGSGGTDNDQYFDAGPATAIALTVPVGVWLDVYGTLFIASADSHTIRKVTQSGNLHTLNLYAGGGSLEFPDIENGSRNPPLAMILDSPYGVWSDTLLNVYVADTSSNVIHKVSVNDGMLGTVAGKLHTGGSSVRYKGDGGLAVHGTLYKPRGMWGDSVGNVYVADTGNHALRKLSVNKLGSYLLPTAPTSQPTASPTQPTSQPTSSPTAQPTSEPTQPTSQPTAEPTQPTSQPTAEPTQPTSQPTASPTQPTSQPTASPTGQPTANPTQPTSQPTAAPTGKETPQPLSETVYNISTVVGQNGQSGYYGDNQLVKFGALNSPTAVWGNHYGDVFITDRGNNVLRKIAKNGILTTCAGNTALTTRVTSSGMATQTPLSAPYGVWGDSAGNVYVTEYSSHVVNKISDNVVITIVSGILQTSGFTSDNVAATSSRLNSPCHITGDVYGNVYFADSFNHRIRKLTFSSLFSATITTFAGSGNTANDPNVSGRATSIAITVPVGVWLDSHFNLYITSADSNTVQKVTYSTGNIITLFAGGGTIEFADMAVGSRDEPLSVILDSPYGVWTDTLLNVHLLDSNNNVVRKFSTNDNLLGTVAGKLHTGGSSVRYKGDGGLAIDGTLYKPRGMWGDSVGNVYVADTGNHAVRKLTVAVAGHYNTPVQAVIPTSQPTAQPTQPTSQPTAQPTSQPTAEPTQPTSQPTSEPTQPTSQPTAEPTQPTSQPTASPTQPTSQPTAQPTSKPTKPASSVTDSVYNISTIIGMYGEWGYFGDNSPAKNGAIKTPSSVWGNSIGDLFIAEQGNSIIRKISSKGILSTYAGSVSLYQRSTVSGYATSLFIGTPGGIWGDTMGRLYITEYANSIVDRVTVSEITGSNPMMAVVAGVPFSSGGYTGENQPATSSKLRFPYHISGDSNGNIYISDTYNNRIRKVTTGVGGGHRMTTIAGNGDSDLYGSFPTGLATSVAVSMPIGVWFEQHSQNIYIASHESYTIRKMTYNSGANSGYIMSLFAGNGQDYPTGALESRVEPMGLKLSGPYGLWADSHECVFVADYYTNAILRVSALDNLVSKVAGKSHNGDSGVRFAGDGKAALLGTMYRPTSVWGDSVGNLFIADSQNHAVRKLTPTVALQIVVEENTVATTNQPSSQPSYQPSSAPVQPTSQPTSKPTVTPTQSPSQPTTQPSAQPTSQPSVPTSMPSKQPSAQPSSEPTQPTSQPSGQPTSQPTRMPVSVHGLPGTTRLFRIVLPFLHNGPPAIRGDGHGDIILNENHAVTESYILLGGPVSNSTAELTLSNSSAVLITNAVSYDDSGRSVSNAGDINGDGYDDLIIGVPFAVRAYVVFGNSRGFVEMTDGFTIFGASVSDLTGWSVSAAGDVNRDGYADILISAPNAKNGNLHFAGAVYLLYGRSGAFRDIYLSEFTSDQGVVMFGGGSQDYLGVSVSGAGDVNGDGYDDIVIGSLRLASVSRGAAYIIYGADNTAPPGNERGELMDDNNNSSTILDGIIQLNELTAVQGYEIVGRAWSKLGYSVSNGGDVNNDTFADVIIGSVPHRIVDGIEVSYLIYGDDRGPEIANTTVTVESSWYIGEMTTAQGVVIHGGGVVVSSIGDINHDGYGDVLIGNKYDKSANSGFTTVLTFEWYLPTVTPAVVPTQRPIGPTSQPTVHPTAPTPIPTLSPSKVPTLTPSFRPTLGPTQMPTIVPSRNVNVPTVAPVAVMTVTRDMTTGGRISRGSLNVTARYNCNSTMVGGDIYIEGDGGGVERAVLIVTPVENLTITMEHFSLERDKIELVTFNYTSMSEMNITKGSVIINLPNRQTLKLLNLNPENMTESAFVFRKNTVYFLTANGSRDTRELVILYTSIFVSLFCVGLFLYWIYANHHYLKHEAKWPPRFLFYHEGESVDFQDNAEETLEQSLRDEVSLSMKMSIYAAKEGKSMEKIGFPGDDDDEDDGSDEKERDVLALFRNCEDADDIERNLSARVVSFYGAPLSTPRSPSVVNHNSSSKSGKLNSSNDSKNENSNNNMLLTTASEGGVSKIATTNNLEVVDFDDGMIDNEGSNLALYSDSNMESPSAVPPNSNTSSSSTAQKSSVLAKTATIAPVPAPTAAQVAPLSDEQRQSILASVAKATPRKASTTLSAVASVAKEEPKTAKKTADMPLNIAAIPGLNCKESVTTAQREDPKEVSVARQQTTSVNSTAVRREHPQQQGLNQGLSQPSVSSVNSSGGRQQQQQYTQPQTRVIASQRAPPVPVSPTRTTQATTTTVNVKNQSSQQQQQQRFAVPQGTTMGQGGVARNNAVKALQNAPLTMSSVTAASATRPSVAPPSATINANAALKPDSLRRSFMANYRDSIKSAVGAIKEISSNSSGSSSDNGSGSDELNANKRNREEHKRSVKQQQQRQQQQRINSNNTNNINKQQTGSVTAVNSRLGNVSDGSSAADSDSLDGMF